MTRCRNVFCETIPNVCGNVRTDDAKITGITPLVFTRKRKVRRLSTKDTTADDALGVLNGNPALPALHEHDERDNGQHHGNDDQYRERSTSLPLRPSR